MTIEDLFEVGQKLGMKKDEIKYTLKRQKKTVIAGALVVVALAFIGNLYFLGMKYGGISLEDFNFRILRMIRTLFGL